MFRSVWFRNFLAPQRGRVRGGKPPAQARRRFRPRLEHLEDRLAPAIYNVTPDGSNGTLTLQQAVADVNADNTADTIIMAPGTYELASQLTLTNSQGVTIQGASSSLTIIDGASNGRDFLIDNGGTNVIFQDLTIQGGKATDDGSGGATAKGGGILDLGGNVTLSGVVVQSNQAQGGLGQSAFGGGVYVSGGSLTIKNSTIQNNSAVGGNGSNANSSLRSGGNAEGGGLFVSSGNSVSISGTSLILNNTARAGNGVNGNASSAASDGGSASGGGLYAKGANLSVSLNVVTVQGNSALGGGGGNGQNAAGASGTSGAIGGNGGSASGGGLFVSGGGTVNFTSLTLSGNSAHGGAGGKGGNGAPGSPFGTGGGSTSSSFNFAGAGGLGGDGGAGGSASGGGAYISATSSPLTVGISSSTLNSNTTTGGVGGLAGNGGVGGNGGRSTIGGSGGFGGAGGAGGSASGGGVYASAHSSALTLQISATSTVNGNIVTGGIGGGGGMGGTGGGATSGFGGFGGFGGSGGAGGFALGGGIFARGARSTNTTILMTVDSSSVSGNTLHAGAGGFGGTGGAAGTSSGFGGFGGLGGTGGNMGGGGLYFVGSGASQLNLTSSSVANNHGFGGTGGAGGTGGFSATGGPGGNGGVAQGGGIYSSASGATITLFASTLSGNQARGGDGGNGGFGGASGFGGFGGSAGFFGFSPPTPSSGFRSFSLSAQGGGLFAFGNGVYVLVNSTLANNTVTGGNGGNGGGGILGGTGGYANSAYGGGVWFSGITSSAALRLTNTTVSGNTVVEGQSGQGGTGAFGSGFAGGAGSSNGGGVYVTGGSPTVAFTNTLVALNQASIGPDVKGAVTSSDHDLIGIANGSTGFSTANGDILGSSSNPLNPALGPLANNGGPTQTVALLSGSPAIDAGDNAAQAVTGPNDQRGSPFVRVYNNTIDIGAYEVQPTTSGGGGGGGGGGGPSSLAGFVYLDSNHDGTFDQGDTGLAGVTIVLSGPGGTRTFISNGAGAYSFPGLSPGTYTITISQPSGLFREANNVGSLGGSANGNTFTVTIPASGGAGTGYNFGESLTPVGGGASASPAPSPPPNALQALIDLFFDGIKIAQEQSANQSTAATQADINFLLQFAGPFGPFAEFLGQFVFGPLLTHTGLPMFP